MLLNLFLVALVVWWLLSYMLDHECEATDRVYYDICANNPEVTDPRMVAILIVGGPIRLTGEMLKDRSRDKRKK